MLKNSKVVFISITLKSWSGRKLFGPYYVRIFAYGQDILVHVTGRKQKDNEILD